jgi:DNA-binding transcriptional regulator YhcF (GntR family)
MRKICVIPIKAVFDQRLTHGALQALAALCAYCNRAGITWVSQTRLAKELGISQQAVAKQFKQLREFGYLETVRRGFKGERTDTLRVIFDETIDAETAMAVTSSIEDTRPPVIKKEQAIEAETPDKEGQQRIAQLISKALKQPLQRNRTMPKSGETRTVKEMKDGIRKAQSKQPKPVDKTVDKQPLIHNSQVVIEEPLHSQPNHNLEVVENTKNSIYKEVVYKDSLKEFNTGYWTVLNNSEFEKLIEDGLTVEQITASLDTLLPLYAAEGIEPTSAVLATGIRQLQADAR